MDELTIDGKIYVSSKRAAAITGYAKDYIGQLCREGRVEAKLVGRSWYVYEPSLKKHRFSDAAQEEKPKAETAWGAPEKDIDSGNAVEASEKANIQAVWDVPAYTAEEVKILPELEPVPEEEALAPVPAGEEPEAAPLSDMQSAWQEWFSTRTASDASPAPRPIRDEKPEEAAPIVTPRENSFSDSENVPVRTIVSDIAPVVRHVEPTPREYAPPVSYAAAKHVSAARTSTPVRTSRRASSGYRRTAEILLVVIIALFASMAFISTGVMDALHIGGTADIGFIRFLEGQTVVEK